MVRPIIMTKHLINKLQLYKLTTEKIMKKMATHKKGGNKVLISSNHHQHDVRRYK